MTKPVTCVPPTAADQHKHRTRCERLASQQQAAAMVQDSTRTASMLMRDTTIGVRGMRVVAGLANGDHEAVEVPLARAASAVRRWFGGGEVAVTTVGRGFGRFVQWSQLLGVPFAIYDCWRAAKAHGDHQNAEIANAAFSVVGGAAGVAGIVLWDSPLGMPILLVSQIPTATQLFDTFVTKGRIMNWLGRHVVKPLRGQA